MGLTAGAYGVGTALTVAPIAKMIANSGYAHLANERGVACWPSPARSRSPALQKSEAFAVPSKHSGRLHERYRGPPCGRPPRQHRDGQALRASEHHSLALQPALRRRQLLPEKLVLRDERCTRTEEPHHQPHESDEHLL